MYKKNIKDNFQKDGYKVSLLDINFKDVSICQVEISGNRKNFCKIKNSPIYYFIIDGTGEFLIGENIICKKGDLIEIPQDTKFTYKGYMQMLEIIPNKFDNLIIEEEIIR